MRPRIIVIAGLVFGGCDGFEAAPHNPVDSQRTTLLAESPEHAHPLHHEAAPPTSKAHDRHLARILSRCKEADAIVVATVDQRALTQERYLIDERTFEENFWTRTLQTEAVLKGAVESTVQMTEWPNAHGIRLEQGARQIVFLTSLADGGWGHIHQHPLLAEYEGRVAGLDLGLRELADVIRTTCGGAQ